MDLPDAFAGAMTRCPVCGTVQRVEPPAEPQGAASTNQALDELGLIEVLTRRDEPDEDEQQPIAADKPRSQAEPDAGSSGALPQPQAQPQTTGRDQPVVPHVLTSVSPGRDDLAGKSSTLMLLGLALGGAVLGFLIGLLVWRDLAGAYLGAGLGWLVGFAYGLVIVFGVAGLQERVDSAAPADGRDVACRKCGRMLALGTQRCPHCGSALGQAGPFTLLGGCLDALAYARGNVQNVVLLAMLFVGANVWRWALVELIPRLYPAMLQYRLAMAIAGWTVLAMAWVYYLHYGLHVAVRSLTGADRLPDLPALGLFKLVGTALRCFGLIVFYIVPVVTLPLLPLGIAAMAYTADARAYNFPWAVRAAVRRPRELAIVWLVLMMWAAAAALVMAVIVTAQFQATSVVASVTGPGAICLSLAVRVLAWAFSGVASAIFVAALFRCVGLYGRFNRDILLALPAMRKSVRLAVAMLLTGLLGVVIYGLSVAYVN